jgi:hypothetical protein
MQGDVFVACWEAVDNAAVYRIFRFDEAVGNYVFQGETTGTNFTMALPGAIRSPVLTFFVLAENQHGRSLPSEPASLILDDRTKPEDKPDPAEFYEDDQEAYHGDFYTFVSMKFLEIERRAMEHFRNQEIQFRKYSEKIENRMRSYFRKTGSLPTEIFFKKVRKFCKNSRGFAHYFDIETKFAKSESPGISRFYRGGDQCYGFCHESGPEATIGLVTT